ncbi:MAG: hypothetical protein V3U44_07220, partial [Alphaproteobacteria bacterium]
LFAAAAIIAVYGLTGPASANKGVDKVKHDHFTSGISAPFVADGGAEVSHSNGFGSKGDLDNDGNWGVITGELAVDTAYEICLGAVEVPVGVDNPLWLADATTDGVNGDLEATGSMDAADAGDYQAPSLQIREDAGDDCSGDLVQESGTTIVIDAD